MKMLLTIVVLAILIFVGFKCLDRLIEVGKMQVDKVHYKVDELSRGLDLQ